MSKLDNLGNVLIRSDLNVPIKNGKITDNFRILKSVGILESILDKSRTITFTSHMGRPNGKDLNLSLRPVAESMSDFLGKEVRFIEEVFGEKVEEQIEKSESKIFLLENLRFEKGRSKMIMNSLIKLQNLLIHIYLMHLVQPTENTHLWLALVIT